MRRTALRILKQVAKQGEVSLSTAIRMASSIHKSHLDQYPLALLLEEGYLGITVNHIPPEGMEMMREFSLAVTLHMFTLPRDAHGIIHYLGIKSSGSLDPEKERVFLKSKGYLYLDERAQRSWDRLWSFIAGFSAGCLVAIATAWARKKLGLP
jgi:hypothetical protein